MIIYLILMIIFFLCYILCIIIISPLKINYTFISKFYSFIIYIYIHIILVYLHLIQIKHHHIYCILSGCISCIRHWNTHSDDFGTLRIRSAIVRSLLNIRVNHLIPDPTYCVTSFAAIGIIPEIRDETLLVYVTRLSAAPSPTTTCANWLIKSRKLLFPRHVAPPTPSAYGIRI